MHLHLLNHFQLHLHKKTVIKHDYYMGAYNQFSLFYSPRTNPPNPSLQNLFTHFQFLVITEQSKCRQHGTTCYTAYILSTLTNDKYTCDFQLSLILPFNLPPPFSSHLEVQQVILTSLQNQFCEKTMKIHLSEFQKQSSIYFVSIFCRMKMDKGELRLHQPSEYKYRVSGHNKMIKLPNGKVGFLIIIYCIDCKTSNRKGAVML